jgi:hypothetical protein
VPKFNCEVTFDLTTTVEPDDIRIDEPYGSDVTDWEDNSYFSGQDVETDGGSVTFTVEAEDEDEAQSKAEDAVSEGSEVSDDSGFTWIVVNVSASVEKIEEPMTLARAIEILSAMADEVEDEDRAEAIKFVLAHLTSQQGRITALESQVAALQAAASAAAPATA